MKLRIELEKDDIAAIYEVLLDWMGLALNDRQIQSLVSKDANITAEMVRLYMKAGDGIYIDTFLREMLMDAIGMKLIGRKCPTGGDGEDICDKFYADLHKASADAGIEVQPFDHPYKP